MKNVLTIEIKDAAFVDFIFEGLDRLESEFGLNAASMKEALQEVIDNILLYAYEEAERFMIKALFSVSSHTFRIDIIDSGLPFDFSRYRSESLQQKTDHSKGFYRIYDLVEHFYFSNIPGVGKCFSLISEIERNNADPLTFESDSDSSRPDPLNVDIHLFRSENAEGIARLIYRNYDYTYYKALYYEAEAIRKANQNGEIISIVAESYGEVVGHFAMIPSTVSRIAEIGAAAVDPRFKRQGIMNRMFDQVVAVAQAEKLCAIYGEGMMLHPYSQKANIRHGMIESAVLLGEVISSMEIEHRIKTEKRSGVVVAFLLFEKKGRSYFLPAKYRSVIEETCHRGGIEILNSEMPLYPEGKAIDFRINPHLKTGTLVIDAHLSPQQLDAVLDTLLSNHCDMIFADINLHRIQQIDALITLLNERRFFYSGVLFYYYRNEDYLRLQRKNTPLIDEEQLICYSDFSRRLLSFILDDEASLLREAAEPQ